MSNLWLILWSHPHRMSPLKLSVYEAQSNGFEMLEIDAFLRVAESCCHFISPINTIITKELHYITHLISGMFRRIITQALACARTHKKYCRIAIESCAGLSLRLKCEILLSIMPIAHVNTDLGPCVCVLLLFLFFPAHLIGRSTHRCKTVGEQRR